MTYGKFVLAIILLLLGISFLLAQENKTASKPASSQRNRFCTAKEDRAAAAPREILDALFQAREHPESQLRIAKEAEKKAHLGIYEYHKDGSLMSFTVFGSNGCLIAYRYKPRP